MTARELPPFIPTMPYGGDVSQFRKYGPFLVAQEFRGWREEVSEVTVIWGDPGTRQKPIRATVARFPCLLAERNEAIDVRALP